MQIDTLSQINEVINSLVKKGNFKQANNLNKLFLKMAQDANNVVNNSSSGTTPSGNPTGAGEGSPPKPTGQNQNQDIDQNMMNVIKQFYVLKKWANDQNPRKYYAYSRGKFFTDNNDNKRVFANTVGELLAPLGVDKVDIQELAGEAQTLAKTIIQQIKSANNWTGVAADASKAINDKYDLGYNFEQNKYYIGDPNSNDDVIFKDSVNELESVYNSLGQFYSQNKKLPDKLTSLPLNQMSENKKQDQTKQPAGTSSPGQQGQSNTAMAGELNAAMMA